MTLTANLVGFGRILRRAGLPIGPADTRLFMEAIEAVGFDRKRTVQAAGRAIFVRRREDRDLYDRAFAIFWRRYGPIGSDSPPLPRIRQDDRRPPTFPARTPTTDTEILPDGAPRPELIEASDIERIRHADFASLTGDELTDAARMLARIKLQLPRKPSRRWVAAAHRGARPASSRMFRAALSTGGDPLRWRWLEHPTRPRPIVLIADISGSMEPYSRLMLRFAHALGQSGAPVETFVFGTRLTRITRQLRIRDADAALGRVGGSVVDWNGGTRIGESLRELNRRWVRRTVRSGAVVLIVSDGWERGDPELLGTEMAKLRRACHRILWLNPLAAQDGFRAEV
ncbi:MAG: vWA domain-containing protein, partial [Gemmatimonadales bacterium]